MALRGKGKFIIVDLKEQSQGGITVVGDDHFAKGVVVTNGPYVILDVGEEIIFALDEAKPLGLEYPPTYRVITEESLVAVEEPDEDADEEIPPTSE